MSSSGDLVGAMDRYRSGDERGFAAVYPAARARVMAELRRFRLAQDVAEDLVQETFVRAHGSLRNFSSTADTNRRVLAWFGAIARHTALDYLRAHGRASRRLARLDRRGFAAGGETSALTDSPETVCTQDEAEAELQRVVWGAVESLTPLQRTVVEAHHLRGLSIREIARSTGVNPVTLRVRVHRACRQLEGLLRDAIELLPRLASQ